MLQLLNRRRTKLLALLMPLCLIGILGCQKRAATAQIRGKVLFKDGTVPKGGVCVVKFEPAEDTTAEIRKAASGRIEPDGSFEMATRKPGDGVFLGNYAVTFSVWKGPRDPTSLIALKYTRAGTTPYKIIVDGDKDDLFYEIEPIGAPGSGEKPAAEAPAAAAAAASGASG